MSKLNLTIDGMHCGGCEKRVEKALSEVEGVRSAEADHGAGTAKIRLVAGKEDIDAVRETVEQLGYEVTGHEQA